MHGRGIIIIVFWVGLIGMAFLGWRSVRSASSQAAEQVSQRLATLPGASWMRSQPWLQSLDHRLAESIRVVGNGEVPGAEVISEKLDDARAASMSATLTLTPDEVWDAWNEHGSGAVASLLGKKLEWEVAGVSAKAVSEARYQYCVGVVQQYESR